MSDPRAAPLLDALRRLPPGPIDAWMLSGSALPDLFEAAHPDRVRIVLLDPHAPDAQKRRQLAIEARGAARDVDTLLAAHSRALAAAGPSADLRWSLTAPTVWWFRVGDRAWWHPYLHTERGAALAPTPTSLTDGLGAQLHAEFEQTWATLHTPGSQDSPLWGVEPNLATGPTCDVLSVDIDGPLLPFRPESWSASVVAAAVADYLRWLRRQGVRTVANTGRGMGFVQGLANTLLHGCFDDFILENGHLTLPGWDPTRPDAPAPVLPPIPAAMRELSLLLHNNAFGPARVEPGKAVVVTAWLGPDCDRDALEAWLADHQDDLAWDVMERTDALFKVDIGTRDGRGGPAASKGAALRALVGPHAAVFHIGDGANDISAWEVSDGGGVLLDPAHTEGPVHAAWRRGFGRAPDRWRRSRPGLRGVHATWQLLADLLGAPTRSGTAPG